MTVLKNKNGMVLAAAVMLIIVAAVVVLGVTTFVVERLRQLEANQQETEAVYLAQAGIEAAVYNYRFRRQTGNGYFTLGQNFLEANRYYVLGGSDADLVMVDTSAAILSSNNRTLSGLVMQNATNTRALTLDRMTVTWNNSRRLSRIRINNGTVWSGNAASGVNALIRPQAVMDAVPTQDNIDELRFSGSMVGATVDVRFIMTDGSFKDVRVYPASNNFNFTVSATGQRTGSTIYRTARAVYNALTSKIIQHEDINSRIAP